MFQVEENEANVYLKNLFKQLSDAIFPLYIFKFKETLQYIKLGKFFKTKSHAICNSSLTVCCALFKKITGRPFSAI